MKRLISTIIIAICTVCAFAQSINISFTGKTIHGRHVDMDSIVIHNITQGWTATLVAPDTSCSFDITAIKINSAMAAELSQNVPNPFHGTTEVSLSLPKPDKVGLQVHDIGGRLFADYNGKLPEGEHRFEISLASPQSYLLSATTSSGTSSVKMVNLGSGGVNKISYLGQTGGKALRDGDYDIVIGDELECTGYTTYCDSIYESELYTTTITEDSDTECQLRFNLRSGTTIEEVTACDAYQWINGIEYTESTDTATCTLTNSMGCDSVITLHLTIYRSETFFLEETACDSYEYNDSIYIESTDTWHIFTTINGCDSIVFLRLTIRNSETREIDSTVCYSYEWDGHTYTESGTQTITFHNIQGCDSTISINFHVINSENVHQSVDLGLSVRWATCNVGATNPEDFGDYFAWGETVPKEDYSWETYRLGDFYGNNFIKYNSSDGLTVLEFSDDAATVNWGCEWRMPTISEIQELKDNCTWTWTTENGVYGYRVTSHSNTNSIFLPAAGYRIGTTTNNDIDGCYWSSSLYTDDIISAWYLYFYNNNNIFDNFYYGRFSGHVVRPVCQ